MELEDEWKSKIARFDFLVGTACVDTKSNEEFLFDILQDLFSENIGERMKIELVLLIQQYEEELIDGVEKAEQVCGSLLNLYQSLTNNVILFKTQVLVTVTGICVDFNLIKEAEHLYQDFVSILIDVVMRVNSGHPLLRKICSDCLFIFEDVHPGSLIKYITILLKSSQEEKLFPVYSHYLVVASVIFYSLTHRESDDEIVMDNTDFNINKSVSFLVKGINLLSPPRLILMLERVLPCSHQSKIRKSVLNMLLYCLQSWDISHIFLYIYIQHLFINLSNDDTQIKLPLIQLADLIHLNQLKPLHKSIIQHWIHDYMLGIYAPSSEAYIETILSAVEPKIYTKLKYFPLKLAIVFKACSVSSGFHLSVDKQSSILRMLRNHSKYLRENDKFSDLFSSLFLLYKNVDSSARKDIILTVQQLAVGSLKLVMYTIDFCDNIEDLDSSDIYLRLLSSIVNNLISLELKDIFSDIKSFFLVMERIAMVKELCPISIIRSLKGVVRELALRKSSWQEGSLLLSITRNLIINNDRHKIRYEIGSLLWDISQYFPHLNIRDRALSYYLILGKMSSKCYKDVFVSSSSLSKQPNSEIMEVTPVVSQGPLLVRKLKSNYLSLAWKGAQFEACHSCSFNEGDDLLGVYNSFLSSDQCDNHLSHKFLMTMENDCPDAIFAIKLDLSTSGSFDTPKNIYCSHLERNETNSETEGNEITIRFKPKSPVKAKFNISATFIDKQSNCWFTNLKPFNLEFQHLFKPLQLSVGDREELFPTLWRYIEDNQEDNENFTSALSVKHIKCLDANKVLLHLHNFIVTQTEKNITVGIFLPPQNHVLLKCTFDKSDATVWIATDDIGLLDEIDIFLESLTT